MTLPRRDFLRTTCGLGIGTAAAGLSGLALAADPTAQTGFAIPQLDEYERILARTKELECLGLPRSWSVVQQGFLPVSPERVIILESRTSSPAVDRWGHSAEKHRVLERLRTGTSDYERTAAERGVSSTKVGLILRITEDLTRYYSVPAYWEQWAYWLTVREALGCTGGGGYGMAHQFQHRAEQMIVTTNSRVNWWLVLIPDGTEDWDAHDGQPVHVVLAHVFTHGYSRYPGDSLRAWSYCSAAARSLAATKLSKLDRVSAARLFNQHVISALPTWA